jgi:hypothetical protein
MYPQKKSISAAGSDLLRQAGLILDQTSFSRLIKDFPYPV